MKKEIKIVEIIIIIISIFVLGLITYNQFGLALAKSKDIDRKNSLNELGQTIRLYYADYGVLPKEELINSLWGKEWRDGNYVYQNKLPEEGYFDKEYCYLIEDEGDNFSFFADLENKTDIECQNDKWECGDQRYCYRRLMEAKVLK